MHTKQDGAIGVYGRKDREGKRTQLQEEDCSERKTIRRARASSSPEAEETTTTGRLCLLVLVDVQAVAGATELGGIRGTRHRTIRVVLERASGSERVATITLPEDVSTKYWDKREDD
jgi:hypothetical protein